MPTTTEGSGYYDCETRNTELRETYAQEQRHWLTNMGLKIGDTVKVTEKTRGFTKGWGARWNSSMTSWVGCKGAITAISPCSGVCLNDRWWFPYFILEPVGKDAV